MIAKPAFSAEEKQTLTTQFILFESDLRQRCKEMGLDYSNALDFAQLEHQIIQLSFTLEQEAQFDDLIRYVRNHLASNFIGNGPYPVSVLKVFSVRAEIWSLTFYFAKVWEHQETIQP